MNSDVSAFKEEISEASQPPLPDPPGAFVSGVADTRSVRARRWSRMESIEISSFKAIEGAKIALADVTILVGPNGCGKSSALQAIHWAARAASYIAPKNAKEMIAFDRIDYVPSSEPLKSAYRSELGSHSKSQPTKVIFNHAPGSDEVASQPVTVRIFAARNRGGVTAHIEGGAAVTPYKQRSTFITAYIPGLAGLSEREVVLAQPPLRRQAASGDAGSVLRNVLLNLASRNVSEADTTAAVERLKRLNELVGLVHPGIELIVNFDEREDFNISASYRDITLSGHSRSLETAATGVLQVVQIFAYLILFRPKIMLIDEPDAHLHPDKQERLIEALEGAATEFDTQIILTTHSPHIVRAASAQSQLVWMQDGVVKSEDDGTIRRLLGWGGLDKEVIFFVEDEEDLPIRTILRQWPSLNRRLAICRCFGVENLPKDKMLQGLIGDGSILARAIVHRDRDFMTDEECEMWRSLYSTPGAACWITLGADIEAYFCDTKYLSALYSVSEETAADWRRAATMNVSKAKKIFFEKRQSLIRFLWPDGGSPNSDQLWVEGGGPSPSTVKGKSLLKALKPIVKAAGKDDRLLDKYVVPSHFEMATELKELILKVLAK
ncbi:MAG: ATP-dependent nuclease [Methylocystis sp.]|uniref:ATP-dependent nuclease n=1 Tax=Methylocystis sp. TaxID=1911079 RepID=UPI003DA5547B